MTHLIRSLTEFGSFMDQDLDPDEVEHIIRTDPSMIIDQPIVVQALNLPHVLFQLQFLHDQLIEYTRDTINTKLNWNQLLQYIEPTKLLANLSCLVELGNMQPLNGRYRNAALLAGQTVILLVSIPGADDCNTMAIERTLGLFELLPKFALTNKHEKLNLLMSFTSLLEYVSQVMLAQAHSLSDNLTDAIIKMFNTIVQHYWDNFYCKYCTKMYELCFDAFDNMCKHAHGGIHNVLNTIMNGTLHIHSYSPVANSTTNSTKYPKISDWFLAMLDTYPTEATEQLSQFIKAVLTNPPLISGGYRVENNIDICVMYERKLYRKCDVSIVSFLLEMEFSSNVMQRTNLLEFIIKALLAESAFHGVSREIELIRMLIVKINDPNDKIKVKAMMGFLRVAEDGNEKTQRIFKELFKPERGTILRNRLESNSPPSTPSSGGGQTTHSNDFNTDQSIPTSSMNDTSRLIKFYDKLLPYTQRNLSNHSAFVRAASIILLEFLTVRTIINVVPFLKTTQFRALNADTSMKVRGQMVISTEKMLIARPNVPAVIAAYVRVTLDLAADNDEKVQDLVMNSFKRSIFDKIEVNHETSNETPWRLLQDMLSSTDTKDVRMCIGKWIHKLPLTLKILFNIESHTKSRYSKEAWILLSLVAPEITSRTPQMVVDELMTNLSTHASQNDDSYVQLEILSCWLKDIKTECKTDVQKTMRKLLLSGDIVPSHVQRVFELCTRIKSSTGGDNKDWTTSLIKQCIQYIRSHIGTLEISSIYDVRLVHYIYVYGEALPGFHDSLLDKVIVECFKKFIRSVIAQKSTKPLGPEMAVKIICVVIFLSKCSLFDFEILRVTIPLLGRLLYIVHHEEIIKIVITGLCDIFILNANMANHELPAILAKTRHESHQIRLVALQEVLKLIYKEYIKLRGDSLLYILACLCDPHPECAKLTHDFLTKYTIEKDKKFMQLCLKETPFIMNDYNFLGFMKLFRLDFTLKSPIQGAHHQKTRQYMYRFFVYNMDVEKCYEYFSNLKMIYELFHESTETMKRPEGLNATRDFFYIFTHICTVKAKPKASAIASVSGEFEIEPVEQDADCFGRQKNATQISKAALNCILEYTPTIAKLKNMMNAIDTAMLVVVDELCWAMSNHFSTLMDSAMPKEFWKKYQR